MEMLKAKGELDPTFLAGGGEMGALMRAHDWQQTPLGNPSRWSQSLRTVVRLMLNAGHPMYVWWGVPLTGLYNYAYRKSIGPERHPGSLGQLAREVWAEIWDIIGPQIHQVMERPRGDLAQKSTGTHHAQRRAGECLLDLQLWADRRETAPNGIGVLVVCSETTAQVVGARRLAKSEDWLRRLNADLNAGSPKERANATRPASHLGSPGRARIDGSRQQQSAWQATLGYTPEEIGGTIFDFPRR
jgi:hypothetical protein